MTYIKTRNRLIEVKEDYKYTMQKIHKTPYGGFVELIELKPNMDMFPAMDSPLEEYPLALNTSHIEEIYPKPS
jgi:hypothetical protein